ncbi:MAG TPA: ABC transporter permease, partial [Kofleriaceae bacterium]|nr:ABC transporter permease [Kofleriaceae bacterium]
MSAASIVKVAGLALLRNKTRSALTTLGVVIGVAAVIAMVAVGEGARRRVEQTFEGMGTNLLIVVPGAANTGGMFGAAGSKPTLTWGDLEAIRTEARAVATAAPVMRSGAVLQAEDQNWTTGIIGTSPEYLAIRNWHVVHGRPIDRGDIDGSVKVVLLGTTVVEHLWGAGFDPTGRTIRIRGNPFVVAGVLEHKGQSPMGQDYDDTAIVPYSTFQTKLSSAGLGNYITGAIFVSANASTETLRAQRQIEDLLRDRHKLAPGMDDDFQVRNLSELAAAQQQGTAILTTLLAAIAIVSLVVGGIGIMNIMLVSVTERTREIGVRMAVGAKPGHILAQFLVEALTLSLLGGLLGVAGGLGTAEWLAGKFQWPMLIRPDVVI